MAAGVSGCVPSGPCFVQEKVIEKQESIVREVRSVHITDYVCAPSPGILSKCRFGEEYLTWMYF